MATPSTPEITAPAARTLTDQAEGLREGFHTTVDFVFDFVTTFPASFFALPHLMQYGIIAFLLGVIINMVTITRTSKLAKFLGTTTFVVGILFGPVAIVAALSGYDIPPIQSFF